MLESLKIQNYRILKNLEIRELKRVNLFTGKNNTGKSSILEAVSIYARRGDLSWILDLLKDRGEVLRVSNLSLPNNSLDEEERKNAFKSFCSMFSQRRVDFSGNERITIGPKGTNGGTLSIRAVKFINQDIMDENPETKEQMIVGSRRIILSESEIEAHPESRIGIELSFADSSRLFAISSLRRGVEGRGIKNPDECQFVGASTLTEEVVGLWDSIALTEKESLLIDALRIIEPRVDRITFAEGKSTGSRQRTAIVKLNDNPDIFPLKSMGDGINRILNICLALVNADGGYLLVDEFENGLHYTVQEKLWEVVFDIAKKLNVQLLATTHSNDCIRAFQKMIGRSENHTEGALIRLQNVNDKISNFEFSPDELEIAGNQSIDLR
jgi:hypothetical protein